jgi:hypothetical protein
MNKWLARAKSEIAKATDRATANTDVETLTAAMAVPQPGESEKVAASNGSNGSTPTGYFQDFAAGESAGGSDPAPLPPLPPPWDALRDLIRAGWRAEFSPPDGHARQSITWVAPGQGQPRELHQGEATPIPRPEAGRAPMGSQRGGLIRCADCRHQIATGHPALIACGAGRQSPAACGAWWKFDPRWCEQYEEAGP